MTPHFGLYATDDLVFLHQQDGGVCLTPGLSALESPFPVSKGRCPHDLRPAPGAPPPSSPLLDVLRPIPNGGAYWAPPEELPLIREAHLMAAPVAPIFIPVWATHWVDLVPQLTRTNVAPLILVGYEAKHLQQIGKLLDLPRVRTVLFCGAVRPPGTVEVRSEPITEKPDWRAAGAAVLHDHVQSIIEQARS